MISEVYNLIEGRTDVTLTTYILQDSPELLDGRKRPAVIVCPGGAYFYLSDREGEPVALAFARMGYHAFVLRYSVCGGCTFKDITKPQAPDPEKIHPAPVRDMARAFLLIREHAEEWKVDMDRVAVCGFSAGAHESAMYSVYWNKPLITEYFGRPASDFKPAAAILGYPLTDYTAMKADSMEDSFTKSVFENSSIVFLGEASPSDDTLTAVSPALLVDAAAPPTYIWSTAGDDLIPVQQSILMAKALADHKIPFELHIFQDGSHGLSTADQASAQDRSQLNSDAAKWVDLCGAWLLKRFALSLPEKTM